MLLLRFYFFFRVMANDESLSDNYAHDKILISE